MSAKSDYIVLIDAGQACICNQYGSVRNRVGDYGATSANISSDKEFFIVSYRDYVCIFRWDGSMHRRICPGFNVAGAYFCGNNRVVINKVGGGGGVFNYEGGLNTSF